MEQLDGILTSTFDPQDADRRAIMEDKAVYDRFFGSLSKKELMKKMSGSHAYTGFDESDFEKLQRWSKEVDALSQPVMV